MPADETASVTPDPGATLPTDDPRSGGTSYERAPAGYEIECELGRGGMGVVYKARQTALKRHVALKMVLPGIRESGRFRTEAESMARLAHPNIVQVHEVGEVAGVPYCALEYIDGGTLAQKFAAKPRPPREVAELVRTLALAIAHAHERGVIHRDLKPANVLLTREGTPKITDFGLAKQLDDPSGATQTGQVMGTPAYMAPEQAAGHTHEIGPAADVYALGAILYEGLTGRPPFTGPTTLDVLDQVLRREPVSPRQLQPGTPRDLETICLKCLEKEPGKRYGSAQELAEDLRRFLAGEPIRARPPGLLGRLRRWVGRNPAVAALLALVMGTLATGTAVAGYFAVQAQHQAELATQRAAREEQAKDAALEAERQRARQLHLAEVRAYAYELALAGRALDEGDLAGAATILGDCREDLRHFEHRYLWGLLQRRSGSPLPGHTGPLTVLAYSPDGKTVATAGLDGKVRLSVATGEAVRVPLAHRLPVVALAFSPDGKLLATGSRDGTARLWDVAGARPPRTLTGHKGPINGVAFHPDGKLLATGSHDGTIRLWDLEDAGRVRSIEGHTQPVTAIAFGATGRLASADRGGGIRVWKAETGEQDLSLEGHQKQVGGLAFSPDGDRLASAGEDLTVRLWDLKADGRILHLLQGRGAVGGGVAFSPDGAWLATTARNGVIHLWNPATGQEVLTVQPPRVPLDVRFSPDGRYLGAVLDGGTGSRSVHTWDLEPDRLRHLPDGVGSITLVFGRPSPEVVATIGGPLVAVAFGGPTVQVWDLPARRSLWHLGDQKPPITRLALDPTGTVLATGGPERGIHLRDARTGAALRTIEPPGGGVNGLAFSPDGARLAAACRDRTVRVWETATGKELLHLEGHRGDVLCVGYSPDGRRLASGEGDSGDLLLWDGHSGQRLQALEGHAGPVASLAFRPDSKLLASVGADRTVRLWNVESAEAAGILRVRTGTTNTLAFTPDGQRLATGHNDGTTKVWDLATGQELLSVKGSVDPVRAVAFSADGTVLTSIAQSLSLRVWTGDRKPF